MIIKYGFVSYKIIKVFCIFNILCLFFQRADKSDKLLKMTEFALMLWTDIFTIVIVTVKLTILRAQISLRTARFNIC